MRHYEIRLQLVCMYCTLCTSDLKRLSAHRVVAIAAMSLCFVRRPNHVGQCAPAAFDRAYIVYAGYLYVPVQTMTITVIYLSSLCGYWQLRTSFARLMATSWRRVKCTASRPYDYYYRPQHVARWYKWLGCGLATQKVAGSTPGRSTFR